MDFIKHLQIKNFKSIKDLTLDCRRINVLIGKPNVGKSNILEALDVCSLSQMLLNNRSVKIENESSRRRYEIDIDPINLKDFFRVDKVQDLFYQGDRKSPIQAIIEFANNGGSANFSVSYFGNGKRESREEMKPHNFYQWKDRNYETDFNDDFILQEESEAHYSSIAAFKYREDIQFHDIESYGEQLMPPYGNNLPQAIQRNPSLQSFINDISRDSGIEFVKNKKTDELFIQTRIGEGLVFTLPYKSIADTLKRQIFYLAAIKSGYTVVTLEEPEAHSFPPYVSRMADEIIETKETQFFIATHSTVLLTNLIENTPKEELRVFVCDYDDKNHQTIANPMSEEQLSEALVYGIDMFFNINHFLDDPIEHTS